MAFLNRCCCCNVGAVIPRWQNISKARPAGDTGGTHYTATPYPRFDRAIYDIDNYPDGCNTLPAGSCGNWLVGGDLNGLSIEEIEDTVDDIMACAGTDSTHVTKDHNCYLKNGDTVDMRATKLFGGQWVLAKKFWHGAFGWKSNDACAQDPNIPADQTKYLQYSVNASWNANATSWDGTSSTYNNGSYSASNTVNRLTGIVSNSLSISQDGGDVNSGATTVTIRNRNGVGFSFNRTSGAITNFLANMLVDNSNADTRLTIPPMHNVGDWYCTSQTGIAAMIYNAGGFSYRGIGSDGSAFDVFWPIVGTADNWTCSGAVDCYYNPSNDGVTWVILGTTTVSVSFNRGNTGANYGWAWILCDYVYHSIVLSSGSVNAGLSSPYTSAKCYEDFKGLLAAWDMSDLNLASLRTDEKLALAPLCLYDEVGPISPSVVWQFTMDNFTSAMINDPNGNAPGSTSTTSGQHDASGRAPGDPLFTGGVDYQTTWSQMAWVDPNNYIWKYPNGSYSPPTGFNGGASILMPMRTGAIIAHTQPGSDRHFWFNYSEQERLHDEDLGRWEWFNYRHGGFSDNALPPVTLRWMNNEQAQYDPVAYRGVDGVAHPGNYPQAFLDLCGTVLTGAKYVRATQKWPSVNYGRPCAADKYAADQTTICCVQSCAAGSFTVKATGEAIAPGSAGGIAVNDYVISQSCNAGIYKVTAISDDGTVTDGDGNSYHQFTLSVGAKIDDLPTGYSIGAIATDDILDAGDPVDYIGRLRFPTASGICARAAITTSYAAGVVSIVSAAALPYFRKDPTTGTLLADIYDSTMTLLVSGASLTRVDDTHFTFTHAAMPTAAYMTGHGYDWTFYENTTKRTAVFLEWKFNPRAANSGYTSPPTWFADTPGCISGTVTQFNYNTSSCRAVVGIVPYYDAVLGTGDSTLPPGDTPLPVSEPLEDFTNQVLFSFPAQFDFDSVFGSHWQAAVETTMPDPFWQRPFKPDCVVYSPNSMQWKEDNGTGQTDYEETTEGGATILHRFFPHRPWVEASSIIPVGRSLPSGISLEFDPAHNLIAPPYYVCYSGGLPLGDDNGGYASIEQPWGFTARACADIGTGGRFSGDYAAFVTCP